MLDAGIVDENIHRPEGLFGGVDEIGDLIRPGHIGAMVERLWHPECFQFCPRRLDLVRLAEAVMTTLSPPFAKARAMPSPMRWWSR